MFSMRVVNPQSSKCSRSSYSPPSILIFIKSTYEICWRSKKSLALTSRISPDLEPDLKIDVASRSTLTRASRVSAESPNLNCNFFLSGKPRFYFRGKFFHRLEDLNRTLIHRENVARPLTFVSAQIENQRTRIQFIVQSQCLIALFPEPDVDDSFLPLLVTYLGSQADQKVTSSLSEPGL